MREVKVVVKKIDWNSLEAQYNDLFSTLYPARKKAVEKLNNPKARIVSLATGLLMQEKVEKEWGIKSEELDVRKEEQGKPYIYGCSDCYFNISHSGDKVAIAYGNAPVGLDIEQVKCRKNDLKVAKRCFTPDEYIFITDTAFEKDLGEISHSVEERFFMVWTMKEAYLKYKGTGISVPMNSFEVKPYEGVVAGENLSCQSVVINDYVYSVCVEAGVEVSISFE